VKLPPLLAAAIVVEPLPSLWSLAIIIEPPLLWLSHHHYHGAATVVVEPLPLLWSCHRRCC